MEYNIFRLLSNIIIEFENVIKVIKFIFNFNFYKLTNGKLEKLYDIYLFYKLIEISKIILYKKLI